MRYLHVLATAGLVLGGAIGIARAQTVDNVLGFPRQAIAAKGTLVMCGGGGRTPEEVFDEFVRLAGGRDARIVFIPSAVEFADVEEARRHFAEWEEYGCASLVYLDAKSHAEADTAAFVEPLKKATAVWIAGGDQERLAKLYSGTKLAAAVRDLLARGGVVGGISAGAAVMSQVMIRDGSNHEAVVGPGFGLIDGAIIDQHFSQRGRYARLLGLLEDRPNLIGLGIDEDTSLDRAGKPPPRHGSAPRDRDPPRRRRRCADRLPPEVRPAGRPRHHPLGPIGPPQHPFADGRAGADRGREVGRVTRAVPRLPLSLRALSGADILLSP